MRDELSITKSNTAMTKQDITNLFFIVTIETNFLKQNVQCKDDFDPISLDRTGRSQTKGITQYIQGRQTINLYNIWNPISKIQWIVSVTNAWRVTSDRRFFCKRTHELLTEKSRESVTTTTRRNSWNWASSSWKPPLICVVLTHHIVVGVCCPMYTDGTGLVISVFQTSMHWHSDTFLVNLSHFVALTGQFVLLCPDYCVCDHFLALMTTRAFLVWLKNGLITFTYGGDVKRI